jgi:hypothetical protein
MNNNINLTKLVNKTKNTVPYTNKIITSDNYVKTEKIIADDGLLIYGNEKNITINSDLNIQTGTTGPIIQLYGPGGENSCVAINFDTFKSPDNIINGRYYNKNPSIQMIAVDNGKYSADLYFKIAPSSTTNNNLPQCRNIMRLSSDGSVYIYNNLFVQKDLVYEGTTRSNGDFIVNGNTYLNGQTFSKDIFVDGKLEANQLLIKDTSMFENDLNILGNLIVNSNLEVFENTYLNNNLYVNGTSNFIGDATFNNITIDGSFNITDLEIDNLNILNNLNVGGDTTLENNCLINNNLYVNGTSLFNDNGVFNNDVLINGNLIVSGNTILNNTEIDGDTLDINAVTTITQEITINSDVNINGDLFNINSITNFDQKVTFNNDIDIDGNQLNINAITTINQDTTFNSNILIDGDTLDINAITTINQNATFNENVVIGTYGGTNTLEVNSISTFNNDILIDGNTLDINAITTITQDTNIEGTNLYINAITEVDQDATFNSNVTIGTIGGLETFDVNSISTFNNDVTIDGNKLYINAITEVDQQTTFNNDVYIGITGTNLNVYAVSTFYDDVEIYSNNFYVDAESEFVLQTTFDENVNMVKNCYIENSLAVGNTGFFGGNVLMGQNLGITGSIIVGNTGYFASNLQVKGNLLVNGSSTFKNNCLFETPISVNSTSSFIGVASFTELPLCSQIPSLSNQLVNKQYLDTLIAGLKPKEAAQVGTTANIVLSGNQTIDTYTTTTGDRVLVMFQTNPIDNGIYISDSGAWSRSTDYAIGYDAYSTLIFVENGDINKNKAFIEYLTPAIVGTDALGYTTFASIFFNIGQGLEYVASTTLQVKNNLDFVNNIGTVLSNDLELGTTGFNTNIYSTNLNVKGQSYFQNSANFQSDLTVGLTATFNNDVEINGTTFTINTTTNNFSGINNFNGTSNFNDTISTQNIEIISNYNLEQASGSGIILQNPGTGTNILKQISLIIDNNLIQSGTGIIYQEGTGFNNLKEIKQLINNNLEQSGTGIIIQNGTGTNILKAIEQSGTSLNKLINTEFKNGFYTNSGTTANFQGTFQINNNTMTFPNSVQTIVGTTATQTLTNKYLENCTCNTKDNSSNDTSIASTAFVKNVGGTQLLSSNNTWTGTNYYQFIETNGIKNTGNISTSSNISAGGTITATSTITASGYSVSSDYRIKENIVDLNEKHIVDNLRPVTYFNKNLNKIDMGFIAHEVQEEYSFLVNGEKDGDNLQSINYISIIALLVKEIKDLKKRVNDLENITK